MIWKNQKELLTLQSQKGNPYEACARGVIGSRARLRIWCLAT